MRASVLGSGLLLLLVSLVLIDGLPLTPGWRALVRGSWLLLAGTEWYFVFDCYRDYRACRVAAGGTLELVRRDGELEAARLAPGTVVLARLAWLRVRTASGRSFGELVSARGQAPDAWRRLAVISRHTAAC